MKIFPCLFYFMYADWYLSAQYTVRNPLNKIKYVHCVYPKTMMRLYHDCNPQKELVLMETYIAYFHGDFIFNLLKNSPENSEVICYYNK